MKTVRVLQVVSTLGIGGAETWLLELVKYAKAHESLNGIKLEVDIFLTGEGKGELEPEFKRLGVTLIRGRFGRSNLLGFTKSFRRALRENKYDAIHDHQDLFCGIHFLAGVGRLPPRRIAHFHTAADLRIRRLGRGLQRKMALAASAFFLRHLATDILATSRQVLGAYGFCEPCHGKARTQVIYCGIDVGLFQKDQEECRRLLREGMALSASAAVVLFVGRLEAGLDEKLNSKNPYFALDVIRHLRKLHPASVLLLAGAKPTDPTHIEQRIHEQGLDGIARILGPRRDIPELMLGADLLLFPSTAEGLGMAVVEAQSAGLRVLASDTTPNESIVTPDLVSFFPLQRGAETWAHKAAELMSLPQPNSKESNRSVADSQFAIARSATDLLKVYGVFSQPEPASSRKS